MARPTNDERLAKVHADAIVEFDQIQSAVRDERKQSVEDRRFATLAGAMWDGALGEQFENKLRLECNKVHLALLRIYNEYRSNRITVDFVPKAGASGKHADALADTCDGLYRADEQDSGAEEAYDLAFDESAAGGYGAFRLCTEYEDDESEEDERQRIRLKHIPDADTSVFFDLGSKRQDHADAKRCYVLTSMTPEAYREEYDDDPATWSKDLTRTEFDWYTPDVVYVAELYAIEEKKDVVHVYRGMTDDELRFRDSQLREDDTILPRLAALGYTEVRSKKIKRKRVHKYILSGSKVLEDCGYICGPNIPVVMTYGKRWFVDNVERAMGHVRLAKDTARLGNMIRSKVGMFAAESSVEQPIFTPQQIAGHQVMWSERNVKDYGYLLVNAITDASGNQVPSGPLAYTKTPDLPPTLAALMQITEQDLRDILGNPQEGEKMVSNIAEKTVELIQDRIDMQTYIYMSNFGKAIKRAGEIWLGMAREVLSEEGRVMKTVGAQGEPGTVELRRPVLDEDTGEVVYENDLADALMEVAVEIGPTSSSKRRSTVRALSGVAAMTKDPETAQVLEGMIMMNLEGEGIQDVRDYFRRKLLKIGAVKPTEEEAAEMQASAQGQPPDPNALYLTAAAQEAMASAKAKEAGAVLSVAKAAESKAKTAETVAGISRDDRAQLIETVKALGEAVAPPQPGMPA